MSEFLWIGLGFILVAALIPVARALAFRCGMTDKPGGRKHHEDETPLVGGLVIFPVFMAVGVLAGFSIASYWPLYLGIAILLLTGALDDRYDIGAWARFFVQIAVASLVVVFGDARLDHLGDLFGFGQFNLGFMAIPFSIVAVTLFVNAVNLMDGLDGLAAGKGLIALLWLMAACTLTGAWGAFAEIGILAACLCGFLLYNMRHPFRDRAAIFLGDAGSLALGLVLAWYCIGLARDPDPAVVPITIAWIIGLPVMDACGQFYRRVKEGRHPFSPDRGHFHHHFIHAGIPVKYATPLILGWAFVMGGVGVLGIALGLPQVILSLVWTAMLFAHIALSNKPDRFIAFLKMRFGHQ
ncbi:MAG: glycosyltransferase family 4 protein [Alphaproteobacteria bacterium]